MIRAGLFFITAVAAMAANQGLQVVDLRTEYLKDPSGIDETAPRLSWRLSSQERGARQSAYRILVASSEQLLSQDRADLWNSGKVSGSQTTQIVYRGKPLQSRRQCFWKVRVYAGSGKPSPWSATAHWSMGLLASEDWTARWISYKDTSALHTDRKALYLPPARYYRKEFQSSGKVRRAMLYASALGIYDAYVNGARISERMFAPGWSDYRRRVYYSAYDVTALVKAGPNAVGAVVADGWYSGYVGYGLLVGYGPNKVGRYFYGKTPALLAQLEIEFEDGRRAVIGTDESWHVTSGAVKEADILMGETYDARIEPRGWAHAGFNADKWEPAIEAEKNGSTRATFYDRAGAREVELGFTTPVRMQTYMAPPISPIEEVHPVSVAAQAPGVFIFDLGQNISGIARLKVRGAAGTTVRLRFGEMLHPDGRLMTENLRKARATDTYVLRGDPTGETWTPRFTYHGFRYVEVTGFPGTPGRDAITGIVVHSATPLVSTFEASDPMVNRLFRNIVWTQRANFLEVPTDCPQRDERLGWTGAAQAYVRTATYNADVAAFFTKWLDDLEEAQQPDGGFTDYAPYPMWHGGSGLPYGTAWMDAGIICPYMIYRAYGDTRVINRHWEAMMRFMRFRHVNSPEFQGAKVGNPWGDWLSIGSKTPIEYIDAAYFAYTSRLMAEMARATGCRQEAAMFDDWFAKIRARFAQDYVLDGGRLKIDNQTAYALALDAGLLSGEARVASSQRLAELIAQNNHRMTTGFLGTKVLLPVLSANNQNDLAVRLFQSRQFPSWGYEVANGATTMWERWNSYTKDKGLFEPGMNSFSHYAFGAVAEWMFATLAGIDTAGAGFEHITIKPQPPSPDSNPTQKPISWVSATYDSIRGLIASRLKRTAGDFQLDVTIPPNTRATVYVPASSAAGITESGQPLARAQGIKFERIEEGRAVLEVGSGTYRFRSHLGAPKK
ncbi:MAG: family 78 glycoside hydrolase catalytic domain [Bryobacteraceae bacterium]